jgi:hypothetical protein
MSSRTWLLAGLTHRSALIAWGGFYFKVARMDSEWKLVDDSDLTTVHPPRSASIGARSHPSTRSRTASTTS